MKHRHASGFLLGAIALAAASLLEAPDARSQVVTPACDTTVSPAAITGAALNTAAVVKTGVQFTSPNLVLSAGFTCGSAISTPINLTALGLNNTQMVITAVRLVVSTTNDVRFSVSTADVPNTGPHEWVPTYDCDGAGASTDRCARLPDPASRALRWKVDMCNTTGAPTFSSIRTIFDYVPDNEIYNGGIAVNDTVSFFGGFSQPGDLGQFYALNTDLDATNHWTARERLQADSSRRIFTTSADGTQKIDFTVANRADSRLLAVLGVANETLSEPVIRWVREQQRFGVNAADGLKRRFGGVIASTPTVVTKPDFPVWFSRAAADTRLSFQTFQDTNAARPPMVLYGAKDGMVHALFADPRDITRSVMGTEAWAFIPGSVASRMKADFDMTTAQTRTTVTAFPDTWPVVDDVLRPNGQYATIAVLNEGRGGKGVSVIDITNTATGTPASGYTVTGPTPKWARTPGTTEAGQSMNRAAVARVRIGGADRFMVIAGTGVAFDDPNHQKGRVVSAYDAEDGTLYWQFQTRCSLTTSITVFETNDVDEAAPAVAPLLDGYMDRAVFADRCGYVYKLNLTSVLNGGWNRGIGSINVDIVAGNQLKALFQTTGGLPVTGNIGARALVDENTTRVALFFGTGGLENVAPFPQNSFYVIFAAPEDPADTNPANLVLGTILGTCATPTRCEKFYGGVRVNPEQVIFTRVLEPDIGIVDCDPGRTVIEARDISGDVAQAGFLQQSSSFAPVTVNGMITSPLTTRGNAIFFTDSRGRANRIGDTNTATGATGTLDEGNPPDPNAPMLILGWRQVY